VATEQKSRVAVVGQWISLALVFFLVLEATCRVEDWVMYRMSVTSPYSNLNDLVVRDADGMHGRPNAQFEKWSMNNLGMRAPETPLIPPPGTLRVFTVGASETFGLRESPGHEFPQQLEDSLNIQIGRGACGGEPRLRFQVLNAAFPGMGVPTIEQDIRNRLRRMHPDFVFAYPSPAQYLDDEPPFAAPPDSASRPTQPTRLRALRPRSIERISDQLKLLLPEWLKTRVRGFQRRKEIDNHPADWQFTSVPENRVALFESDLRRLIGTIRATGAEPILATHGNLFMDRKERDAYALVAWEKFYPRATRSTIIAFDSVARVVMLRVATDSAVVVVDAAKRLAAAPAAAFADFVHFTDLGSSHMAAVGSEGVMAAARKTGRCRPTTQ
jgi:hypothetical protein